MLRFDWDPNKAEANEAKHDVRFSEAATAYRAPLSITIPDQSHHSIRIISARLATKAERRAYEQ